MSTALVSTKGQVTLPKEIRQFHGLDKNDRLVFASLAKDLIMVRPLKKSFLEFGGSVEPKKRPENFDNISAQVRRGITNAVIGRR